MTNFWNNYARVALLEGCLALSYFSATSDNTEKENRDLRINSSVLSTLLLLSLLGQERASKSTATVSAREIVWRLVMIEGKLVQLALELSVGDEVFPPQKIKFCVNARVFRGEMAGL